MKNIEDVLKNVRYEINHGSNRNLKRRHLKKLLQPLVNDNDPEAILLLATIPSRQSDKKMAEVSFKMAKRAANLGFPPAISILAEIYYEMGDYKKTYPLYWQAADLDEPHALYVLSAVYEYGIDGFPKDLELAKIYKERAVKAKKWDFYTGYNDEFIMY